MVWFLCYFSSIWSIYKKINDLTSKHLTKAINVEWKTVQCFKHYCPVQWFNFGALWHQWSSSRCGLVFSHRLWSLWSPVDGHVGANHHPLVLWPLPVPDRRATLPCSCWDHPVLRAHSCRWADINVVVANSPQLQGRLREEKHPHMHLLFQNYLPLSHFWLTFLSYLRDSSFSYLLSLIMHSKYITISF